MDSPAEQPKPIFVLSEVGNAIKTLLQNYQFSASNRRKLVEATNLLHQVFMEVQKIQEIATANTENGNCPADGVGLLGRIAACLV